MSIYDDDGATNYQVGKVYDNDGTANFQIGKVYDNNGSVNSLIYSAEQELYTGGNEHTEITGGYTIRTVQGSVTYPTDNIWVYCNGSADTACCAYSAKKINVSGYSTLVVHVSLGYQEGNSTFTVGLSNNVPHWDVYNTNTAWIKYFRFTKNTKPSDGIIRIALSGATEGYLSFTSFGSTAPAGMHIWKVLLE